MESKDPSPPAAEPTVPAPSRDPESGTRRRSFLMDGIIVIGLAMLGAVAAWQVGEHTYNYSRPSLAASENYRNPAALNAEMPGVTAVNGALTFGAFGGLLGLSMGLAGGRVRRSWSGALLGAVAGLVVGAAAGALPSFVAMPWQYRHRNDDPFNADLLAPLLVHLGLWVELGLAAGLAFGIGSGGFNARRLIAAGTAGFLGAVLGTVIFELAGALLFPAAGTTEPFAITSVMRLTARLCVALCVALGVIWSLPPARADRAAQPA